MIDDLDQALINFISLSDVHPNNPAIWSISTSFNCRGNFIRSFIRLLLNPISAATIVKGMILKISANVLIPFALIISETVIYRGSFIQARYELTPVNFPSRRRSNYYIAAGLCECLHELTTPVVLSWGVLFKNCQKSIRYVLVKS